MKYLLIIIALALIILLSQTRTITIEKKIDYRQPYLYQWQGPAWPEPKEKLAIITAYTARPEETDDTPDITASNKKAEVGMIANNCLDFGTAVEWENKTYYVEDRMNRRMSCDRFDILVADYETAVNFGIRQELVLVY